jgi:hypothetical protein
VVRAKFGHSDRWQCPLMPMSGRGRIRDSLETKWYSGLWCERLLLGRRPIRFLLHSSGAEGSIEHE